LSERKIGLDKLKHEIESNIIAWLNKIFDLGKMSPDMVDKIPQIAKDFVDGKIWFRYDDGIFIIREAWT